MGKIPEGREPLPDEWFNKWPNVDDFSEFPVKKQQPRKKKDETGSD